MRMGMGMRIGIRIIHLHQNYTPVLMYLVKLKKKCFHHLVITNLLNKCSEQEDLVQPLDQVVLVDAKVERVVKQKEGIKQPNNIAKA